MDGANSSSSGIPPEPAFGPGARSLEAGARSLEAGTRSLEAGARSLEAGDRSLEAGDRSLEAGDRSLEARFIEGGADVRSFEARSIEAEPPPAPWNLQQREPGSQARGPVLEVSGFGSPQRSGSSPPPWNMSCFLHTVRSLH